MTFLPCMCSCVTKSDQFAIFTPNKRPICLTVIQMHTIKILFFFKINAEATNSCLTIIIVWSSITYAYNRTQSFCYFK